jgi:5'(3')-deoxyribonucleotidase
MPYKNSKPILIDMDGTCVDMTPVWLKKYRDKTGDTTKEKDLIGWDFESYVKYPKVLHNILKEKNFFFNLEPMPGAVKYINKLIEDGYDLVFLTQLPRRSEHAANDKRRWIKKYFPNYSLINLIFAHRKHLVIGDILFDDNPHHLTDWYSDWIVNARDRAVYTATITCAYNKDVAADWRFESKKTAWKEFYKKVSELYETFV